MYGGGDGDGGRGERGGEMPTRDVNGGDAHVGVGIGISGQR
jgi:hypothetical protein